MPLQDLQFSGALVTRTTTFSMSTAITTIVLPNQVDYDTDGYFQADSGKFIAPVSGYYAIGAVGAWSTNSLGTVRSLILQGPSSVLSQHRTSPLTVQPTCNPYAEVALNQGDTVDLRALQDSGSNMFLIGGTVHLSIRLLGVAAIGYRK